MTSESLGTICAAWIAWCDKNKLNCNNEKSIKLHEYHKVNVNFAKQGVAVKIEKENIPDEYPNYLQVFNKIS